MSFDSNLIIVDTAFLPPLKSGCAALAHAGASVLEIYIMVKIVLIFIQLKFAINSSIKPPLKDGRAKRAL